jgi:hypothetical protein
MLLAAQELRPASEGELTPGRLCAALASRFGLDPDEPLSFPCRDLRVSVSMVLADGDRFSAVLDVEVPGQDHADFTRGMAALDDARRRLARAAASVPDEQQTYPKLDCLFWRRYDSSCGRARAIAVVIGVPAEVFPQLGTDENASLALASHHLFRHSEPAAEIKVETFQDEGAIAISALRGREVERDFATVVAAFFEDYLPERRSGGAMRMAPVTAVARVNPIPRRQRPWLLRLCASLLLALAAVSWLVRIDTLWLTVGWIWWAAALGCALLMGRDFKGAVASLAGAACTFLGLMVLFGLLYGTIRQINANLIGLSWLPAAAPPRLGEMFLLSLGVAVSAGTTGVALEGWARFAAFVEMLLFFGTAAAVVGAFGRRWLFAREVHITGQAPLTGMEDDHA